MLKNIDLVKFVTIVWVVVTSSIAILILGTTMYFMAQNPTVAVPQLLSNWGGIILGFYFGSFSTIVVDELRRRLGET